MIETNTGTGRQGISFSEVPATAPAASVKCKRVWEAGWGLALACFPLFQTSRRSVADLASLRLNVLERACVAVMGPVCARPGGHQRRIHSGHGKISKRDGDEIKMGLKQIADCRWRADGWQCARRWWWEWAVVIRVCSPLSTRSDCLS